jgi:hypothetical protein
VVDLWILDFNRNGTLSINQIALSFDEDIIKVNMVPRTIENHVSIVVSEVTPLVLRNIKVLKDDRTSIEAIFNNDLGGFSLTYISISYSSIDFVELFIIWVIISWIR